MEEIHIFEGGSVIVWLVSTANFDPIYKIWFPNMCRIKFSFSN